MKPWKYVIAVSTLSASFIGGIWGLDLGASLQNIQPYTDTVLIGQSLIMTFTPNQVYHIGMLMAILSFFLLLWISTIEKFNNGKWE